MGKQDRKAVFQFQIGAIRGYVGLYDAQDKDQFQFQIGAIRGLFASRAFALPNVFQFQIGAIRGQRTRPTAGY